MARVWTHCKSGRNSNLTTFNEFEERHGGDAVNGWNYCKNFDTLAELIDWMQEQGLRGRVSRLAINCHGAGGGGVVRMDSTLDLSTLSRFESDLRRLAAFMNRGAERGRPKLIFTGCSAGADHKGTRFLRAISEIFVEVNTIAFETPSLQVSADRLPLAAGDIWIDGYIVGGSSHVRSGPFHPAATWVRNSLVLRYPEREQLSRPGNRCAYPHCPGHRLTLDDGSPAPSHPQCDGGWHKGCEWTGAVPTHPDPAPPDHLPQQEPDAGDLPRETWPLLPRTSSLQSGHRRFRIQGPLGITRR